MVAGDSAEALVSEAFEVRLPVGGDEQDRQLALPVRQDGAETKRRTKGLDGHPDRTGDSIELNGPTNDPSASVRGWR